MLSTCLLVASLLSSWVWQVGNMEKCGRSIIVWFDEAAADHYGPGYMSLHHGDLYIRTADQKIVYPAGTVEKVECR